MTAKPSSELQVKLKKADPIVRRYIAELEARNTKRQNQIVVLEADKLERDARIKALEKERPSPNSDAELLPKMSELLAIAVKRSKDRGLDHLSDADLAQKLITLGPTLGLRVERVPN